MMSRIPNNNELASMLTEQFLENIGRRERVYEPQRLEIYAADVEADIDEFHWQLQMLSDLGLPIPCVRTSNAPPAPISLHLSPFWDLKTPPWRHLPYPPYYFFEEYIRYALWRYEQWEFKADMLSPGEAVESLRTNLTHFLSTRFSARQSDISESPGLKFKVITQNSGLRVQYSPSYFLNIRRVFGSPTSPVNGWIQPGTYKFGAEGRNLDFRLDPADFDIPPLTEAELVNI